MTESNEVVYGLLTLAGMDVALPLSALREVVSCPEQLAGLPVGAEGLLGAMHLRELVLPVLDLRPLLRRPVEPVPEPVVVVIAFEGQTLGLLAESVQGVTSVPRSALLAMTGGGQRLLFSHTFRHQPPTAYSTEEPTQTVVSVLDAGAVLVLSGVPTVADVSRGTPTGNLGALFSGAGRNLTLLRCGGYIVGLDVEFVHTTLPAPVIRQSVLESSLVLGVTDFMDREVAVADPLSLLGLGSLGGDDVGAGLVLDLGHGYVMLALSELLDLTELDMDAVLPLPGFVLHRPELVAGMAEVPGRGQCLILDGAALIADRELRSMAAVNTYLDPDRIDTPHATSEDATDAALHGPAHLMYSAGGMLTTPLDQIAEILPIPASLTRTSSNQELLGVTVHRGAAMAVFCLATVLGRPSVTLGLEACVLLVNVDEQVMAFAVENLSGIAPLTWSDAEQASVVRHAAQHAADRALVHDDPAVLLRGAPLVQLVDGDRLLPALDLHEVARATRVRLGARAA